MVDSSALSTLRSLHDAERDFAVVFCTFGTDGADAARALMAWAGGQHDASLPPVASLAVDPQTAVYRGKYNGGADGRESRFGLCFAPSPAALRRPTGARLVRRCRSRRLSS